MLLAIETSCDETAVALLDPSTPIESSADASEFLRAELVSSQIALHQPYGGVVPELAAREHLTNLPLLTDEILRTGGIDFEALTGVAVTCGPGLKGCLLVGITYGLGLAFARSIPFLPINHLEGHLLSTDLSPREERPPYPMLVLLVSGGHTELILAEGFRRYHVVARTRDDAVGEAFDKCATLLGLPYPGGPALSELAGGGNASAYPLPIGMAGDDSAFSFSGVKTAVQRLVRGLGVNPVPKDEQNIALLRDVAASVERALIDALIMKTEAAIKRFRPSSVMVCGGVAANRHLRERMKELARERGIRCAIAEPKWCSDNAAMIGVAALRWIHSRLGGLASFRDQPPLPVIARARWPLEDLPFPSADG